MSIQQHNPVSTEEAIHNFSHAVAGIVRSLEGLVKFAAEKQQSSTGVANLGREKTVVGVLESLATAATLAHAFTSGSAAQPTVPTKTAG